MLLKDLAGFVVKGDPMNDSLGFCFVESTLSHRALPSSVYLRMVGITNCISRLTAILFWRNSIKPCKQTKDRTNELIIHDLINLSTTRFLLNFFLCCILASNLTSVQQVSSWQQMSVVLQHVQLSAPLYE